MLHRPTSSVWIAGLALYALLTGTNPVRADVFLETAYIPTSSVVALPTSSILSTSYVVPTAYSTTYLPTSAVYSVGSVYSTSATYFPTVRTVRYRPRRYVERTTYLTSPSLSILPTSYIVPTSYVVPTTSYFPTSYVVPTTSYFPTSYVVPTTSYLSASSLSPTSYVIDNGVVATSGTTICDETVAPAPVRSVTPSGSAKGGNEKTITSEPESSNGSLNERRPSGSIDDGTPSDVTPPVPAPASAKPAATAQPSTLQEPPITPINPPGSATPPADNGGADVPLPAPGRIGDQPEGEGVTTRSSLRPTYNTRNVLRGKVVSFGSNRPESGVNVIVSSLTKNFTDRQALTDADGEFKIALPEGDWTVKVKMPSGSILPVASDFLTATNGRVVDSAGRNVKEFLITR
ncbi:hypothetical protein P12x_003521 [Tundrisphaera lichenicola]|uniref:hypothetical protein n=1 Tax=Tundrisphaera lichenicola TaxID=2029860 RepID=UPI003EB6EE3E